MDLAFVSESVVPDEPIEEEIRLQGLLFHTVNKDPIYWNYFEKIDHRHLKPEMRYEVS